ncbi:hypothetical protein BP6252_10647 [Coleophoma cylindrospora]|uniref:Endoplasmic reticulum lectin n=1 Tax=Coleophoma cylindrospora TaxID=1849047 RepID=A0A3D8QT32_9HELO|nr:hypothetical protein BP6252_10647 [Coleophoma cylindrospora]
MRRLISAVLASASTALASQTVFSVHDDLLAFPQVRDREPRLYIPAPTNRAKYEVTFSDSFISDTEASLIIDHVLPSTQDPHTSSTGIESPSKDQWPAGRSGGEHSFDPSTHTYELLRLANEQYLCTIPIVASPTKNETSEAEAKAAEQKELARATDRGWELLQELEGDCLYFVSGWWSYAFCYNAEVTQFHALPPSPGKPPVPQRDPSTKEFILGKAKSTTKERKQPEEDEWGHAIDVRKPKSAEPPVTELQVKGDSRYLVQRMEDGTTCDLTGKPRRVEVQYHCNPHVTDRIGYIKEITTCTYLLVIYTPRLCSDVAFMPPKENKANQINCRPILPETEISEAKERKDLEAKLAATKSSEEPPVVIGGVLLGGGKFHSSEGQRMPIPRDFADFNSGKIIEVIAKGKSKADGGKVESATDEELQKLDLDPEMVEEVKKQVSKMAKEKGWKIEVVDAPGQVREILGIVEPDDDEDDMDDAGQLGGDNVRKPVLKGTEKAKPEKAKPSYETDDKEDIKEERVAEDRVFETLPEDEQEESEEGSEEIYKDEL